MLHGDFSKWAYKRHGNIPGAKWNRMYEHIRETGASKEEAARTVMKQKAPGKQKQGPPYKAPIKESSLREFLLKRAKELTTKGRKQISEKNFAIPERDAYPIHDAAHARNALARVSQHGSSSEKARVRSAVHAKYPGIGQDNEKKGASYIRQKLSAEDTSDKDKDIVHGGFADKKKPSEFSSKSVAKGSKVEMEHTNSKALAEEIARDHLTEFPTYYEALDEMEQKLKKEKKAGLSGIPLGYLEGLVRGGLLPIAAIGEGIHTVDPAQLAYGLGMVSPAVAAYYMGSRGKEASVKKANGDEEDIGSPLTAEQKKKIEGFLRNNSGLEDEDFHEFAESIGANVHRAEAHAYSLVPKTAAPLSFDDIHGMVLEEKKRLDAYGEHKQHPDASQDHKQASAREHGDFSRFFVKEAAGGPRLNPKNMSLKEIAAYFGAPAAAAGAPFAGLGATWFTMPSTMLIPGTTEATAFAAKPILGKAIEQGRKMKMWERGPAGKAGMQGLADAYNKLSLMMRHAKRRVGLKPEGWVD